VTTPPSNPPGMPPPSHGGRRGSGDPNYGSSAGTTSPDEVRLLEILTRENGDIPLGRLYHLSGLTSDRFRFWLEELKKRDVVETASREGGDYVALKGKLDNPG
jgi:hypothetical protein